VALVFWTQAPAPDGGAYTTLAHWWSGHKGVFPDGRAFDNSKRAAFLPYVSVPASAGVDVELAVDVDELEDDAAVLCNNGWLLADPFEAAGTPERYRSYIRRSRGEFSCARPAYVALASGWISDRTVCYLASARPAVVQDTGPCGLLEDAEGQGIFRFRDPEGAAAALAAVDGEHARQCSLARSLAEEKFDARRSAARLLELSLP
jgi:glycosyltransferase involved in cell wall biosynthesis